MKHLQKFALIFLFSGMVYSQNNTMELKYPETEKGDTTDEYFGTEVKDPYRWLEDDRSSRNRSLGKS